MKVVWLSWLSGKALAAEARSDQTLEGALFREVSPIGVALTLHPFAQVFDVSLLVTSALDPSRNVQKRR